MEEENCTLHRPSLERIVGSAIAGREINSVVLIIFLDGRSEVTNKSRPVRVTMVLSASHEGSTKRGVPPVKLIQWANFTFIGVHAPKQRTYMNDVTPSICDTSS